MKIEGMKMKTFLVRLLWVCFSLSFSGCDWLSSFLRDEICMPSSEAPYDCVVKITDKEPGTLLEISGTSKLYGATNFNSRAGIMLVRFFDKDGNYCGSGDMRMSPQFKCGHDYFAVGPEPRQFSKKVKIPSEADSVTVSVSRYRNDFDVRVAGFKCSIIPPPPTTPKFRMQIVSIWFLMFVAMTFLLYFCLPWIQPYVLLVASCAFYAFFGWMSFVFIAASAVRKRGSDPCDTVDVIRSVEIMV